MAEIILTPSQNGRTLTVHAGDSVIVRLPENPSTGYRWDFAGGVMPADDDYVGGSSPAPGAGGERVVRFVVPASGTLTIRAELRRGWETGTAPQSRFEVSVSVR